MPGEAAPSLGWPGTKNAQGHWVRRVVATPSLAQRVGSLDNSMLCDIGLPREVGPAPAPRRWHVAENFARCQSTELAA